MSLLSNRFPFCATASLLASAFAALLAVPYLLAAAPYARVSDADSSRANRGWRRFLWINYACGFAVTILLILFAMRTP